jgi:peptidoglycan/LPS O-acetylase OafA/YrhL
MNRIKWFNAVRAYGLFLVLGYHLFYDSLPGGFIGVDIFFTFSGFLITALIIEEIRQKDGFSLFGFYKRRCRRILIPLFFSVVFTLPFMLLISPDFSVGVARQAAAALGFVTNWVQIMTGGSYETRLLPSMYIHTWSLAVEMQFYLSWGLVCAALSAVSKAMYRSDAEKRHIFFRTSVFAVSGTLAVALYFFMKAMYDSGSSHDAIYFNTFVRLLPFFIGAAAATVWGVRAEQNAPRPKHAKQKAAALLLVTLSAAFLILYGARLYTFTDGFIYHYGFLLASLLTVVLIYGTHGLHCVTPEKVGEPRLLRAVADMSYDAYLFHWPFYVVFSALIADGTAASLVTLFFTFLFSALTFYWAERVFVSTTGRAPVCPADAGSADAPAARGRFGYARRKRLATLTVAAAVGFSVFAGGAVFSEAPAITSIETDFAVGYALRDAENVILLQRRVGALNTMPLLYAGEGAALAANLLPEGAAPESAPQPVPTPAPAPTPAPTPDVTLDIPEGVTLIGDSVSLGARSTLQRTVAGCYVDSAVSRPVSAGLGILTDLQDRGELREYVVIALGTNGVNNYAGLLTDIIDALEPGHRLIFVTPFDGRPNDNARILNNTAAWIRELPEQYDFITVADWNALIASQTNLLANDRVHMGGQTAMTLYADCVAEAVAVASQKPAKGQGM